MCIECGSVFEDPKYYKETHGLDSPPYEHWSGCPYCGGNYTEAYKCDCCGEYIDCDYFQTDNGDRYCENCITHYKLGEE